MELVYIKDPDFEVMMKIVEIEQETFEGNGNVDLWIIKALIRYGLVFVIKENDKIVCIVEYMQVFNKKSLFLYGISTLKEYRHKGYGNYILNETEKILKNLSYEEIELTVAPENDIAINFYKKHGYIQEKLLKDEYGKGIHRYVMRKKLF
ncbi:N-acetyltransferase [Fusobacterium nucleatum subsp. nucleatum ATCC 25586]|uniref:Acetyltransferase n=2 Tax=Fusobacterium nucleatum subsp. nucleatum TaxID=76856 RepID=Q8R6D1_FUSNN|nr:N-acetyltransferase [Fusobacterium nucleatum]AAL94130.1 Acetyltransferase [Fusobacterium nucleatum subsp. nucleatum ATCC 25586]ALF26218.1 acetyltransferase [Fusobacterium nucleatum subsp. nucleatum]AVQ14478.1 N-acetyltransferase [Fusobacterium nucleatum subsp. nucleatum ATCC 25586]KUL97943.1 acetyltransferase [Fusobacterium nucleatum subsp. nucleatum]MCG6843337.1 GNAT family N-acetyltransferase [Fusobacterium nucleatum]